MQYLVAAVDSHFVNTDASLAEELNSFFACFEASRRTAHQRFVNSPATSSERCTQVSEPEEGSWTRQSTRGSTKSSSQGSSQRSSTSP